MNEKSFAPSTSIRSNTASAIASRPASEVLAHSPGSDSSQARALAAVGRRDGRTTAPPLRRRGGPSWPPAAPHHGPLRTAERRVRAPAGYAPERGLERLAGIGVPVSTHVADEPTAAGRTREQPAEPVLAASPGALPRREGSGATGEPTSRGVHRKTPPGIMATAASGLTGWLPTIPERVPVEGGPNALSDAANRSPFSASGQRALDDPGHRRPDATLQCLHMNEGMS